MREAGCHPARRLLPHVRYMKQCPLVKIFGAIEAGGTKFVCGVGTGPDDLTTVTFPTTTPAETIGRAIEFLRTHDIAAVGVGSFGPVDLDPASPHYGYITSTPKAGWKDVDFAGEPGRALNIPVGFNTDVNAAAIGETKWGAARDVASCLYLTIGTGIGGGAVFNGVPIQGAMHPEIGHLRLPHDLAADPFPGNCPFHGDCFEGLASGPAMAARWGVPAGDLPANHPAWTLEARYIALGIANVVFTIAPARVILGGGVMGQHHLFPLIRKEFAEILNGYLRIPQVERLDEYIVPPQLGDRAGILGALALAMTASA
jgi:fructokinase